MHKWLMYICMPVLLCACFHAQAQQKLQYNINADNGLLHNYVYFITTDSNGYLWLACKKGLLRYNGYEMRAFTRADGLANDEVFNVFEDYKGRMWIYTLSNELGYIYRNKYRKVYFKDNIPFVAAQRMSNTKGGIIFTNSYRTGNSYMTVCKEENDTVSTIYKKTMQLSNAIMINDKSIPVLYSNKAIYKIDVEHPDLPYTLIAKDTSTHFSMSDTMLLYGKGYAMSHFQVYVNNEQGFLYIKDLNNAADRKIQLFNNREERIITPYERYGMGYFVSNKNIYEVDHNYKLTRVLKTHRLLDGLDSSDFVLNILEHPLWHNCYSVPGKGMYIVYEKNRFARSALPLNGYYYAGYGATGKQYWWNRDKKTLAVHDALGSVRYKKMDDVDIVYDIKPYRDGKVLVNQNYYVYTLDETTLKTGRLHEGRKWFVFKEGKGRIVEHVAETVLEPASHVNQKAHIQSLHINDSTFFVFAKVSGFAKMMMRSDTIIYEVKYIVNNSIIAYDSIRNKIWCYNNDEILVLDIGTEKTKKITGSTLGALGINRIEKILFDNTYGNIFIKDYKHLYVYNPFSQQLKIILNDCKLENVSMYLRNNTLVAVGQFGVLFARVEGRLKVSEPIVYYNTKSINYKNIPQENIQVAGDSLLLNTNSGLYSIGFPTDEEWRSPRKTIPYRLLKHYADSTNKLYNHDTIRIGQDDYNVRFELVNPAGVGTPVYKYYIKDVDTSWVSLNANEFNATGLSPDRYYDMSMVVSDDVWQSEVLHYKLFVVPRWWQTYYGIRIVWVAAIVAALLLVWLIVTVTKSIVNRNNKARTMQLEVRNLKMAVELKSIYSQINPHFIFNTLSTGMYFIKKKMMDEAYNHISAFSNLLRAYIKSSRNKYITLAEEIENLKNYITLQQSRFENKFDSEVIVAENINPIKSTIPSLLLQPLVENAINHGLFHKEEKGRLLIKFEQGSDETELVCTIDDDGVGREQSKVFKEEASIQTPSYGTDLVKELINIFNANEPIHIDIEYIDKPLPLTGTTVILTIKNLSNDQRTL